MKIRVEFEVPDDIADGLRNGTLERFGGVIRSADSKHIVAFLREGGNMSRPAASGSALLPTLLAAAGMNAGSVETLTNVAAVSADLLDFSFTVYAFHQLNSRISTLQDEIAKTYELLDREFRKEKIAKIESALDMAEEFLVNHDHIARRALFADVIGRLLEVQNTLLQDIAETLQENQLSLALKLIDSVLTVGKMAAHCRAELGHEDHAISQLKKTETELRPHAEELVRQLVGDQPALYFYKDVEVDFLDRYMQIRSWLHDESDIWEIVVKEAREGFWNNEAIKPLFEDKRIFLYTSSDLNENPFYREAIPLAEWCIENFQRFECYALELESLNGPYRDDNVLSEIAARRVADYDDYLLIIDQEMLERLSRLSN